MAPDGAFYFLEVNTRLQVEHGVTELVAGFDIVREQFCPGRRPAAVRGGARRRGPGRRADQPRDRGPPLRRGPGPGLRADARAASAAGPMPSGPGVRVDTAIEAGDRVPPEYDNLIAKVMVHAGDRDAAIDRLRRALDETEIAGIQTTLPFHRFVAARPVVPGRRPLDRLGRGALGRSGRVPPGRRGRPAGGRAGGHGRGAAAGGATVPASAAPTVSGGADDGRWHRAGLDAAHDRWPR